VLETGSSALEALLTPTSCHAGSTLPTFDVDVVRIIAVVSASSHPRRVAVLEGGLRVYD